MAIMFLVTKNSLIRLIGFPINLLDFLLHLVGRARRHGTHNLEKWYKTFLDFISCHTDIQQLALRKLRMINNAITINDLRIPPANRHEKPSGNCTGQCSVRINDQW